MPSQPRRRAGRHRGPRLLGRPACLSLYERAKAASAAGDLDESLRPAKLAHEVRPDPLLLFSIARILHKQGKTREAVPYYTRFLAAPTEDPAPVAKPKNTWPRSAARPQPTLTSPPTPPQRTAGHDAHTRRGVDTGLQEVVVLDADRRRRGGRSRCWGSRRCHQRRVGQTGCRME